MKLFYLTITILTFCSFALAQKNLKSAYAVTFKGDTLNGFVDLREWDGNPNHVELKLTTVNSKIALTTDNCRYLSIIGREAYQRYAGFITLDQIGDQQVRSGRDTSMRLDTVFLKVLKKGEKLSLYAFSDDIKTRFYITEKDGEMPIELGYRVYYDNSRVDVVRDIAAP